MADFCVAALVSRPRAGTALVLAAVSVTALFGGCADVTPTDFIALAPQSEAEQQQSGAPPSLIALKGAYDGAPDNPQRALAYALGLKQAGSKEEAYTVLKAAVRVNGGDRAILSEYGRLALEFNDVGVAKEALEKADDPNNPDWRVVMARGTALAKEGHYEMALSFFERAYALEPRHPSVLSNLALAYTMTGHAEKGEPLLRDAIAAGGTDPRLKQNLALVLKVQGKGDEAPVKETAEVKPAAVAKAAASNITTSSIAREKATEAAPLPPIVFQPSLHEDYATDTAE